MQVLPQAPVLSVCNPQRCIQYSPHTEPAVFRSLRALPGCLSAWSKHGSCKNNQVSLIVSCFKSTRPTLQTALISQNVWRLFIAAYYNNINASFTSQKQQLPGGKKVCLNRAVAIAEVVSLLILLRLLDSYLLHTFLWLMICKKI